jgi:hypothetical protein
MGHTSPFNPFGPDTTTPEGALSIAPGSCTASGLRVVLDVAPPVDVEFVLQRGPSVPGLSSTLVGCTVTAGTTSCTSGAFTALLAAGDLLVFRSLSAGTLNNNTNIYFGWICQ